MKKEMNTIDGYRRYGIDQKKKEKGICCKWGIKNKIEEVGGESKKGEGDSESKYYSFKDGELFAENITP